MKKRSKYTFVWSDFQPHNTIEMNIQAFKDLRENIWNQVDNTIQVSRKNRIFTYHSTKDLKKDRKKGKNYLNPRYVKQFFKELEDTCNKQIKFFEKLHKTNFKKLTDKELLSLIKESHIRWENTITFFRASQAEPTYWVLKKIKAEFNDEETSILSTPVELDTANLEQLDWYKTVKKSYSKREMLKHAEKYPWTVMCHNTYEEVIETLKQRYFADKKRIIRINFKKEKRETARKQKKLLKKHPELKQDVNLLQKLAVTRMKLKSCWAGTDFYTIRLYQEINNRLKEDLEELRNLYLFEDVERALLKQKKLTKKEKSQRKEIMVGLWKNNKIIFKSGKEAEKLAKKELGELYKVKKRDSIKGTIANPGIVRGIIRIQEANNLHQTREVRRTFQKGEILITQMTQPNIMDIASKAAAIVTDEGGMLSHAAIISREFKIPCIVGTHEATQVFKDGDYIEVDANKGIVRKISKQKSINPNPKDYKKFFTTHAEITCLHSEFLFKGSLGKADLLATYKDELYNIYLKKNKEKICLKEGLELFKDNKKYKEHLKEFKNYIKHAKKVIIPKYRKIPKKLTKEEFKEDLNIISKFWYYYGTTEFPYLDLAYKYMKDNRNLEKNLKEWSKFKFTARDILNAYFFKNEVLDNLLGYVSKKFKVSARFMYSYEILAAFDGKKPSKKLLDERKKCYTSTIIDGQIIKFPYKESLELNKKFTTVKQATIIKGVTANPGIARGRAIISPMLNDYKAIQKINKIMKKGDILIAETTSPDVLTLCNKAAAIVAEQGGMLSHAAVVSRERNIPCIIQTEVATRILKNGDYVEVDANKGIIKKIIKEEELIINENMRYIKGLAKKKLKYWSGKKWYHQRFDGSPYLLHMIAEAEIATHEKRKKGGSFTVHYCFFNDGKADWYISMGDIKNIYTAIIKQGKKNPNFSSDLIKKWKSDKEKFYDKCSQIKKTNLKKLSDEELIRLHDEFLQLILNHNSSSSLIDGFALGTDELISEKIKSVYDTHPVKDKMRFTEVFSTLTAPVHLSFINEAEIELLKIAIKVKKNRKDKKELLEEHQKKFFWTRNNYVDAHILSVKHFEKELNKILKVKKDIKEELERVENTPKENKKKKEKLLRELKLDKELKFLIKTSEDFTYWQDERKKGTFWTAHYASQLLEEIGKRVDIPAHNLKYMSPREVSSIFENKPNINILKEREKNGVLYWDKEGHEILYGKECTDIKKTILKEKNLSDIDDFRGLTASIGRVIGTVKVVKSAKEIDKVKEKDILVAVMTRPDYVPAMKRAAAVVTDEGGVTCHAAIVTRELGIPCIIGTKIATKTLKDGMTVEVNANHGIVRIIRDGEKHIAKEKKRKKVIKMEKPKKIITEEGEYTPENILWFKDLNKEDIPIVGGKGANLGEMFHHFNIPKGFCITVHGYKDFMDETGIGAHIHGLLDKLDVEGTEELDKISQEIRELIMKQQFPKDLRDDILNNYHKLKHQIVAIRSSATAEDLPTASFAGQQDTYLEIEGDNDVITATQKCWASLFTSRAIYYREKNNFHHRDVLISVVVQEMIDAKYAGVMFTVDPVNKKYILIEMVEGLGEALVSGQVTPNSYFLKKDTHEMHEKMEHFDLDLKLVEQVSKIGEKIEAHYNFPMDVEFAYDDKEELFILQARPITTL